MSRPRGGDPFLQELYDGWIESGMDEQDADALLEIVTENQDWLNGKEENNQTT